MAYPGGTYLTQIRGAVSWVGEEFEQLYALLQGYLSKQHDETGAHTEITGRSLTLSANTETGATGVLTADGNVTADADGQPVILGEVGAFNGLEAKHTTTGTVDSHWRIGVGPASSGERDLTFKDVLAGGTAASHVFRWILRSAAYLLLPGAGVSLKLGEDAPGNRLAGVYTTDLKALSLRSGSGVTTSTASGTPVTLFSATPSGRYDVCAYLMNVGDVANYGAFATVVSDGVAARIVANNAVLMTLTLSGTSVQATQGSGAPQTVTYSYVNIA